MGGLAAISCRSSGNAVGGSWVRTILGRSRAVALCLGAEIRFVNCVMVGAGFPRRLLGFLRFSGRARRALALVFSGFVYTAEIPYFVFEIDLSPWRSVPVC